ncbi:MAG: cbb3-type cytochrome c oxidase subunit II [Verrucomicrobiales bacterium]|nr:cbb3-type cytochrome c oxidase subunit II [Verrucomicrobiales bacterium]
MDSLRNFVFGLGACFGVPWLLLIVLPYLKEKSRQPVPYTWAEYQATPKGQPAGPENDVDFYEKPELKGSFYPSAVSGSQARGAVVYAAEGCAQCHTQVIRPVDQFKRGIGADQEGKGLSETRATTAWDYLGEDFAMIGQRRLGPDLANAGYRFKSAGELHAKLYAPSSIVSWTNHPHYPGLYDVIPVEGKRRADAIDLPASVSIPAGRQVVPTADAKALAEYVLGLKRDLPLPIAISGASVADKKK